VRQQTSIDHLVAGASVLMGAMMLVLASLRNFYLVCGVMFVETMMVESWAEHKRQFERVTNADRVVEDRVRAFHVGEEPPKVSQMIYANYTEGSGLRQPC
jgi:hypothetical protein